MAIKRILVLITSLLQCLAFRYAFRRDTKVFPYAIFPEPSIIDNGDNHGKILQEIIVPAYPPAVVIDCILVWLGNGACNRENNKPECKYDGGDCCRQTCIENCLKKANTLEPCQFKCGTFNGYSCEQEKAGCAQCSYHGQCLSQENCLKPTVSTQKISDEVNRLLYNCKAFDWSMGNLRTINLYCGQDPTRGVIHDQNYKKLHFPGCGLFQDQCTQRPCCSDAQRYAFDEKNCTDIEKEYLFYNPTVKTTTKFITTCQKFFFDCFFDNYKYYGQCCQCDNGWSGIDCFTPVCFPNCVHGTCVHPNVCLCDSGWQGPLCNLGKCKKCIYGICAGPETCDCFYGYEGFACDIPISYPPCLHGTATEPNKCKCISGWSSRICDVPICNPPCGEHGHCINPQVCECDQGYFSSGVTSMCDTLDDHMHDPNCITSINSFCTECDFQYYLDPITHKCHKCNYAYDAMCIECSSIQCLECQWPYNVDPATKTCVSFGVFEFTNLHKDVSENEDVFRVYIRRLYGFNTTVTVDYDMTSSDRSYSRIEYRHDTVVFMDQDTELPIDLKVYKRPYFETDDALTIFNIFLLHPTHGAEIGFLDNVTIRYFDDETMNDAQYSYATLNDIKPSQQFDSDLNFPGEKIETSLNLQGGGTFTVNAYSYFNQLDKKTDGKCVFYLIQRDINRKFLRDVGKSQYLSSNQHKIDFKVDDLELKFLHIHSSTQGYSFEYYTNTEFTRPAFIQRIEKHLPQVVSQQELKQFNHASLNITYVAEFNLQNQQEEIRFRMQVAENSFVKVFVNGSQKISTGLLDCNFKFEEQKRRSYDNLKSTRKFPVEVESCCSQTFEFVLSANRNQPYFFEINYIQWNLARNGFCIRMDRESQSLPLDSVDVEAIAITQLTDSPFIVQPILNIPFLDISKSRIDLIPHINSNTKQKTLANQFQCCVMNKYLITHRYEDLQIYRLTDLIMTLSIQTPNGPVSSLSYFDQTQKKHFVDLYYCDLLQTNSILTLTFESQNVSNTPKQIEMIPGPYDLTVSEFVEDNPIGCYLEFTYCYARLNLRDRGLNFVKMPNLIDPKTADFILKGPLAPSNFTTSNWFQTMQESPTNPYFIQTLIKPPNSGYYDLYVRFDGVQVSVYPLKFRVYSIQPDRNRTYFDDPRGYLRNQICGYNFTFNLTVRDVAGDPLTMTSVTPRARLVLKSNSSYVVNATSIEQLSISLFKITVNTTLKGLYDLFIEIPDKVGSTNYVNINSSPFISYWESAEAFNTYSLMAGTGIDFQQIFTAGEESLVLMVYDRWGNQYNHTYWQNYYLANQVYRMVLLGDGQLVALKQTNQLPDIGHFSFAFVSLYAYNQLLLYVDIYCHDFIQTVSEYRPIPGSPFNIQVLELNKDYYCKLINLLYAGFGYTEKTQISQMPTQVIAGVPFTNQIQGRNVFGSQYLELIDPVLDLFLLDFVPERSGRVEADECICSPKASSYCNNFSGNYENCLRNKQCKWIYIQNQSIGSHLNSCVPCHTSNACLYNFSGVSSTSTLQSNDLVNFLLTTEIKPIGNYRAQLNVWTQSGLQMLIYSKPKFEGFVSQQRAFNFTHYSFDSDPVFIDQPNWSVAILGRLKYSYLCDILTPNRANLPTREPAGIQTVTYTIVTNLKMSAYANRKLVAQSSTKQLNTQEILRNSTFTLDLQRNVLFDFELYLELNSVDNENVILGNQSYFLEIYVETFNTERRIIKPGEMFFLSVTEQSLSVPINVIAAAADAMKSSIGEIQSNFKQLCESGKTTWRVPFILENVHIQVRDSFGNQKVLAADETLKMVLYRDQDQIKDFLITQNQGMDYIHSYQIDQAFYVYLIKFTINDNPLPQTCTVNLLNTSVDVTKSTAQLIQQDRYIGHDQCIFASELAYLVVELKDEFQNSIPLVDGDAYFNKFEFKFSFGSEFTSTDCKQYGAVGNLQQNQYICKIRPAKSGIQSLSGVDAKTGLKKFIGMPQMIDVKPSLHKKLFSNDLNIQRFGNAVIVAFQTEDAYGNLITSLNPACDYFQHERIIYQLKLMTLKGEAIDFNLVTTFLNSRLTFDVTYIEQQAFMELIILDGLLLDSGISAKYYTEDNFLITGESSTTKLNNNRKPLYVETWTESLILDQAQSPLWSIMHQQFDRFAMRAACLVKPKYSEIYYFSTSLVSSNQENRISGFELWIDGQLVIGECKSTGGKFLNKNQWASITIHYRVSNNNKALVPQFSVHWQSTSQNYSTLNSQSAQVVALDIWETSQINRAVIFKDLIAL